MIGVIHSGWEGGIDAGPAAGGGGKEGTVQPPARDRTGELSGSAR